MAVYLKHRKILPLKKANRTPTLFNYIVELSLSLSSLSKLVYWTLHPEISSWSFFYSSSPVWVQERPDSKIQRLIIL